MAKVDGKSDKISFKELKTEVASFPTTQQPLIQELRS